MQTILMILWLFPENFSCLQRLAQGRGYNRRYDELHKEVRADQSNKYDADQAYAPCGDNRVIHQSFTKHSQHACGKNTGIYDRTSDGSHRRVDYKILAGLIHELENQSNNHTGSCCLEQAKNTGGNRILNN